MLATRIFLLLEEDIRPLLFVTQMTTRKRSWNAEDGIPFFPVSSLTVFLLGSSRKGSPYVTLEDIIVQKKLFEGCFRGTTVFTLPLLVVVSCWDGRRQSVPRRGLGRGIDPIPKARQKQGALLATYFTSPSSFRYMAILFADTITIGMLIDAAA